MASLKKEVAALLSRFDAAQEAFTENTTNLKKLKKAHKKELKAAKQQAAELEEKVADLEKQLAAAKAAPAPAKKTTTRRKTGTAKRSPGRPRKSAVAKAAPAAPAEPAEPAAAAEEAKPSAPTKRRGRPAGSKNKATAAKATAAAKKSPATKKAAPAADGSKRRPGRPRTKPVVAKSALEAIKGVGPAMARAFEAAGVKTPAQMAKLSNVKMAEILDGVGPRYKNPSTEKIQAYREAATAAK